MKKVLILACAALTACTNDIDLGPNKEQVETLSNAIGFQMAKKNMTTTKGTETALNKAGHYNFGVWGYKASTGVGEPLIMDNYLVGFGGNNVGYKMDASKQTTWGGNSYSDAGTYTDGQSQWAYENMGTNQYFNTTDDHYYKSDAPQKTYLSNKTEQFLRYWDLSSARTAFYAYAPYVNSTTNPVKLEENAGSNSKIMTFPDGTIKMGTDASQNEFMYAVNKVKNADYKNDVKLQFHRLNSRVQIKFWENIPGYKVKIVALNTNKSTTSTYSEDVYAKPAIAPTTTTASYTVGKYLVDAGAKITFSNDERETAAVSSTVQYTNAQTSQNFFTFDMPADNIGEVRAAATPSNTTYYMVPNKGDFESPLDTDIKKTGYTFHVSYQLTAEGTGEVITVTDARVYVPAANCEWAPNKSYTYIFKITKSSNGTTDKKDPKPDEVDIPTDPSLFPIVFDGCTVVDYETEIEKDYTISDPSASTYTLSLDASSVAKNGMITGTAISVSNSSGSVTTTPASSSSITVESVSGSGVTGITVTVDSNTTNNVTVTTNNATPGTYKLVYKNARDEVVATVTFTVTD